MKCVVCGDAVTNGVDTGGGPRHLTCPAPDDDEPITEPYPRNNLHPANMCASCGHARFVHYFGFCNYGMGGGCHCKRFMDP